MNFVITKKNFVCDLDLKLRMCKTTFMHQLSYDLHFKTMNNEHVSTIGMLTSSNHTYFNCDSRKQVKFLKKNLLEN